MEFENYFADELSTVASPEKSSPCFDCSICLDFAKDPVVTLCGHLYCWPCIYKWLSFQSDSDNNNSLCPVCKSEISHTSVVPLYGRGKTLHEQGSNTKISNTIIPPRPRACRFTNIPNPDPARQFSYGNSHRTSYGSYNQGVDGDDSNVWMYGDMIYARVFGNSQRLYTFPNSYHLAGSNTPRLRRQEVQVHRSLNRLTIFLFCCLFLCLMLF